MARWFIKRPSKDRKSFAIVRDNKTVHTDATKSTNKMWRTGDISDIEADAIFKKELEKLRLREEGSPHKVSLLEVNEKILRRYWDSVYEHRVLRDKKAAWYRMYRAVASLDQVPLTAGIHDLQRAVNRNPKTQRHNVPPLNQLLKWMGRSDVRLAKLKSSPLEVNYYTLEDIQEAELNFPEPFRTMVWVAFSTGARLGEIFHFQPRHFSERLQFIRIEAQRYPDWQIGPPKNRQHNSPVLPEGVPWLRRWFDTPEDIKKEWRNKKHAREFRRGLGEDLNDVGIRFHDLRHSYAIHLLRLGASLEKVAAAVGDDITVVQKYYTGFVLHDHDMEFMHKLLNGACRP